MRGTAGTSLVVLLCASAFAPLLTTAGVSNPAALAWMGIAGNVGAEALGTVAKQAIDAVRGDCGDTGAEADLRAVTDELASRLEAVLSRDCDLRAALRALEYEQDLILAEIRDCIGLLNVKANGPSVTEGP